VSLHVLSMCFTRNSPPQRIYRHASPPENLTVEVDRKELNCTEE
jgi:hypothetical protein